ncbi:MAG TPA: LysR family transcriptional regulator [Sandaracinaceae bacterium LLY-WYZ-13_1]|nr:LysR family transcriptional regulator [Sandaracinaceae bacterium LLY-WYZ-13_1]
MSESLDAPITLDQLHVFLCVVEAGSFSKAAKRLRRVQSAVSYSIANLERLLEVELFDRSGRTPVLTDAGRALLADARAVAERVDRLHARARRMAGGVEPRLSLAADMLFPLPALLEGLRAFRERYPSVSLHLRTEALGAVAQLVLDGTCQVGISVDLGSFPHVLTSTPLTRIEMVPVCAPDHPLAAIDGPIGRDALADEIQIVVTDRSERTAGQDHGVLSERTWRVADMGTKRGLLLGGFGWGNMPIHQVRDALEAGELARLTLDGVGPQRVALVAIARTAEPPGPAGSWLLEQLAAGCADEA